MNIYEFPPIAALLDGAYSVVTFIGTLLEPIAGTASSALAIVVLTLLVRTALIPVGISQVKADLTRRRLAPKIAELRRRYGKKPEVLQRKTMELYQEEQASPLAGCLPLLLQAPVVSIIYALFIQTTINGHANALLTHTALGIPLGSSLAHLVGSGSLSWSSGLVFAVIMIIVACVAQASRKLLMPPVEPPVETGSQGRSRGNGANQRRSEQGSAAQAMSDIPNLAGLTRILSFAPFVTAIVAGFVPLAAAIYLVITTSWTLVERLIVRRALGAGPATSGLATALPPAA